MIKFNTKKLKAEMERAGLTQAELARRLRVDRQAVHHYLNGGATSLRTINKLGKFFGIDPKDLII